MVVATLSNPELLAAVAEARAALVLAEAARARVYAGVRQEEVGMAAGEVEKAQAELTVAEQRLARIVTLAGHGNAPQQSLDDAKAAVAAAAANLRTAEARHAAAERGPTAEDRALADATVAAAKASLAVLEQRRDKLTLRAPVDGIVEVVVAEPGEAEVPGRTVLAIAAAGAPWFSFNVREDQLRGLDVGAAITLADPASGRTIPARVTELRRLGDFATWRAARAVGDHDLNGFALRADPTGAVAGLEPGMTVRIAPPS
jgi:HlyD family secretion protein